MKIKGKEIKAYEPEWCCDELETVIAFRGSNFRLQGIEILLKTDEEVSVIIQYCPFCGEKIET